MTSSFELSPSLSNSKDLDTIKSNFGVNDNLRSENSEELKYSRANPSLLPPGKLSTDERYGSSSIKGLSYPLEINGSGGLKTSSNYDRLSEQVLETLHTRVGERVFRQFFGIPELVFETVSEEVLSQIIKKQLEEAIPFDIELDVSVEISEDGRAVIYVGYSLEGTGKYIIKYATNS